MAVGKSGPSAVVGLDIGSELIKVAEAKFAKDGIRITGLGIAPTPLGTIDNNVVVDPKGLGAAIKMLLRDSGIKTKTVVSSVSGQSSVVVRVIEVPRMTPQELAETMKWEVERHVPFSPTEIVMDFAPIEKPGADPNSQSMEVLLAVAQQDAINAHVQTLLAAGLSPRAIDVQPLAVCRPLVASTNGTNPQAVAIVNVGAQTTEVEIYEDGLLVFPGPPLPIAGINLTRAISEALGVTEDEAEMLKKEHGAADATPPAAQPAASDTGFDFAGGAQDSGTGTPSAHEPTAYDTSFQQADTDFSPFDIGAPSTPPPAPAQPEPAAPAAPPSFDISGEDVFDLGTGVEQQQSAAFKPVFDLEDVEPAPQSAAPQQAAPIDFDLGDAPAQPADAQPPVQSGAQPVQTAPASDTAIAVNQAIAPVLAELATEIRRTLEYYMTRYQNRPEVIYLCGGTAKLRDLDIYLANELGVQVQLANPTGWFTVNCPKYSPQYLDEISPLLPVSIGLAIRDMIG